MGTKRHMVDQVRTVLTDLRPNGRVVDLFAGIGSVAEGLAHSTSSVITNDAMAFSAVLARARFTGDARTTTPQDAHRSLRRAYLRQKQRLSEQFAYELRRENDAMRGDRQDLVKYMETAPHVGNSDHYRSLARRAQASSGPDRFSMASLYFGAGYLSLQQAIEVDALRYAIDGLESPDSDWLLASWLNAISVVLNAPGHTAQYLRPNTDAAYERILRVWRRSLWSEFAGSLSATSQAGTARWRSRNEAFHSEALALVDSDRLADVGAVYADPPYTKDQYSRFYHLYESLYLYDFPSSSGAGRVRGDRFSTGFCLKTNVVASFHDLCRSVARMSVPLVLSYPSDGLLSVAGVSAEDVVSSHFKHVNRTSIEARHSTLGGSKGASKKNATENLYVCTN